MTDLISREELLERMHSVVINGIALEIQYGVQIGCDVMEKVVRSAPTVDAEPVRHGRWIEREDKTICSSCDTPLPTVEFTDAEFGRVCIEINKTPCCPNCGAKMMDLEDE